MSFKDLHDNQRFYRPHSAIPLTRFIPVLVSAAIYILLSLYPLNLFPQDQDAETAGGPSQDTKRYLLSQTLRLGKKEVGEAVFSQDSQQIIALSSNFNIEIYKSIKRFIIKRRNSR